MSKLSDKVFRIFVIAAFVGIVVGGLLACRPRYLQMKGYSEKRAHVLRLIEAKKAEIAELKDQQRRLSADRGFVEKLARRNRRVYPGELVFIFDD